MNLPFGSLEQKCVIRQAFAIDGPKATIVPNLAYFPTTFFGPKLSTSVELLRWNFLLLIPPYGTTSLAAVAAASPFQLFHIPNRW